MDEPEARYPAKAAGNSYSLNPKVTAPVLDFTNRLYLIYLKQTTCACKATVRNSALMKLSVIALIAAAFVVTNVTSIFITKSVTSNSESQVVAYLKEKEVSRKAEIKKQRAASAKVAEQMHQAKKKFLEYGN